MSLLPDLRGVHDLVTRAQADPQVVGLVLSGSAAREGMTTKHSDIDVFVILQDGGPAHGGGWQSLHSPDLDMAVMGLGELRDIPGPDRPDDWWHRYAFAHAQTLVDRTGEVSGLVAAWGTLTRTRRSSS